MNLVDSLRGPRISGRAVLPFLIALSSGCAHTVPALEHELQPAAGQARAADVTANELRGTVQALVDAGGNLGRNAAVKARAEQLGLQDNMTAEWIDWFTFQDNVIIDIPGESRELVIVVAHYDKVDANPLVLPSLMLNGLLDPLIDWSYLSDGAIDNGTGVAVALQLAREALHRPYGRSLRVILVGGEESGLRGSRAYAAGMSEADWARLRYAINIDGVAIAGTGNCVTSNVSDDRLVELAFRSSRAAGAPLGDGAMPIIGMSDYASFSATGFMVDVPRSFLFNATGALLPQRSYFAWWHSVPVVSFMACEPIDLGDIISSLVLVPVGSFHGPRDSAGRVEPHLLYENFVAIDALLRAEEATPVLTKPPSAVRP